MYCVIYLFKAKYQGNYGRVNNKQTYFFTLRIKLLKSMFWGYYGDEDIVRC